MGRYQFSAGTMSVARPIVHGYVGPCKTESSQKPVPIDPLVGEALDRWRSQSSCRRPEDWRFCKPAQPWTTAVLVTSNSPQVSATSSSRTGNQKSDSDGTFRHPY